MFSQYLTYPLAYALTALLCVAPVSHVTGQVASTSSVQKSILVLPLSSRSAGVSEFGDSLALQISTLLNQAGELRAITWREANNKLPVHMQSPGCIIGREAAERGGIAMLVCGTYERASGGAYIIETDVIVMASERVIEVPRIRAVTVDDAANQFVEALGKIVAAQQGFDHDPFRDSACIP